MVLHRHGFIMGLRGTGGSGLGIYEFWSVLVYENEYGIFENLFIVGISQAESVNHGELLGREE